MAKQPDHPPKCPSCGKELNSIGYTEYGTLELHNGKWQSSDSSGDADHYCLECNYHFTCAELEELGVI